MKVLYIVGAGGHGKVVAEAAHCMGVWHDIRFVDLRWPELTFCAHWQVVASEISVCQSGADFVVSIGHNHTRLRVFEECKAAGLNPISIVHPRACISEFAHLGEGCVVFAGAVINIGAQISSCAIINTSATIDHDCVIGNSVHISPGANLAGEVMVGNYSWVGIGASVKQCLSISDNVVIGAGACVVSDISSPGTYIGVPARLETS